MRKPWSRPLVAGSAAAAVVAAGVLSAVIANAASGGCSVNYQVQNEWPGGFTANVAVTNLGDPANGWRLTWAYAPGQTVTQAWNATAVQVGTQVTVTNAGWNPGLAKGAKAAFGLNGTFTGKDLKPTTFALNGVTCGGDAGPTSAGPTSASPPAPSASVLSGPPTQPPTTQPPPPPGSGRQAERLDRGVISVRSGNGNLVSWRLLGTDPQDVAFNVYRGSTKVNAAPITTSTNVLDAGAPAGTAYTVKAVVGGTEQAASPPSLPFSNGYLDVKLQVPAGGKTPDGVAYTYSAGDASVGDVDGDGQYEIILKWDPSNTHDNSQSGYTGDVFVDAYKLNGTRLWRIDLGRNIRAGAHYTQFQVYDYDGDGKAEVVMKTADATVDGTGKVIGNANADFRTTAGYVLSGPEFLTAFNGQTGAAMSTVNYDPPRGKVSDWGDGYGNRVDRFLAGTAYLDGKRPSIIAARGYYTRAVVAAWDFRNGALTKRWTFDSNVAGSQYTSQGNHQLAIADVDGDGKDEIIYGSFAIGSDGKPLWNTNLHHGDSLHVGDFDPANPGLEVFKPDEHADMPAAWMADARTGKLLWKTASCTCDNGRGVADDIWAGSPGAEAWSAATDGLLNSKGQKIGAKPSSMNFLVYWDGDPTRELLDRTMISKYTPTGDQRLLTAQGVASNNGTKATPALSGDLFGDWREEVVWRTADSSALRIYSTPTPTDIRMPTLMHDIMYREAIAWQNTAYNQPPHASFYIGAGMAAPPWPKIYTP